MKSFGIWYSSENTKNCCKEKEKFTIDLHINLWDNIYKKAKESNPFIDIGLSVNNFKEIDNIRILVPFSYDDTEIDDLCSTFFDKTIANLVFNDDCTFRQDRNNISSLELSEDSGNPMVLYNLSEKSRKKAGSGETLIDIDLKSIREDSIFNEFSMLYIRFRILSDKIKEELFCNIKNQNWFLESGFKTTQIIDIKVNKKRNMDYDDIKEMRKEKFEFVKFNKIHFLVMEPADNQVDILGRDFIECRKLEEEWNKYLKSDDKIENVLAYHWKIKGNNNDIKEYSKMVKVTSASTSWHVIGIYILVVIIIGIIANVMFTYGFQSIINILRTGFLK